MNCGLLAICLVVQNHSLHQALLFRLRNYLYGRAKRFHSIATKSPFYSETRFKHKLSLSLSHCMCLTGHDKYLSQILSYCPSLSLTFPSVARLLHNKPIYTLPNTNAHNKPLLDKNALSLSLSLSFSLGISNKKFPTCSMSLSFWIPLPLLPPLPRFQCIWSPCCLAEKRVRPKRKK